MGNVSNTTDMKRNVLDKHRGLPYLPSQQTPYTAPSINLPVLHTHVFSTCAAVSVPTSTPTSVYINLYNTFTYTLATPCSSSSPPNPPPRLPNGNDCRGSGVELSRETTYSHSDLRCPWTVSQGRP